MLNKINKTALNFFILLISTTLLSSCGFKLRSQSSLPASMYTIYYQTDNPYGSLEIALKTALKGSGINLVADQNKSRVIFHINSTRFSSDQTSIGPSTQARVYHLVMSCSFSLLNPKGKTLLETQTVSATRDLALAPNEVFEISGQVDAAKQSMQQEIIMKIFDILSSKRVFNALS